MGTEAAAGQLRKSESGCTRVCSLPKIRLRLPSPPALLLSGSCSPLLACQLLGTPADVVPDVVRRHLDTVQRPDGSARGRSRIAGGLRGLDALAGDVAGAGPTRRPSGDVHRCPRPSLPSSATRRSPPSCLRSRNGQRVGTSGRQPTGRGSRRMCTPRFRGLHHVARPRLVSHSSRSPTPLRASRSQAQRTPSPGCRSPLGMGLDRLRGRLGVDLVEPARARRSRLAHGPGRRDCRRRGLPPRRRAARAGHVGLGEVTCWPAQLGTDGQTDAGIRLLSPCTESRRPSTPESVDVDPEIAREITRR